METMILYCIRQWFSWLKTNFFKMSNLPQPFTGAECSATPVSMTGKERTQQSCKLKTA